MNLLWIPKATFACPVDHCASPMPIAEHAVPTMQTINWLRYGVTPIGVADGLAPAEKLAVMNARCLTLYGHERGSGSTAAPGEVTRLSRLACRLLGAMVRFQGPDVPV